LYWVHLEGVPRPYGFHMTALVSFVSFEITSMLKFTINLNFQSYSSPLEPFNCSKYFKPMEKDWKSLRKYHARMKIFHSFKLLIGIKIISIFQSTKCFPNNLNIEISVEQNFHFPHSNSIVDFCCSTLMKIFNDTLYKVLLLDSMKKYETPTFYGRMNKILICWKFTQF